MDSRSHVTGRKRRGSASVAGGLLLSLLAAVPGAAEPADFPTWANAARVAGVPVYTGMTTAELDRLVASMADQNVSVIEADSNLSSYLSDSTFDGELALMRDFATASHARGIKAGWYYPTLEVLTPNGQNIAQTMAKEHPDWVQRGLNGSSNVFYGGVVFWVEDGTESAWMSPSSAGYREYFINRVKKIAATGLDYLWGDVPLLNDLGTAWADTNPASQAAFAAATGMIAPTAADWNDPVWRRWVSWRHQEVRDFLADVAAAGRSVNPDFKFMVETVTMDYGATKIGLDGADLKDIPGVAPVWELDAVSDSAAMSIAREDDWVRLIAMNKYARGASGAKPSWIFTYGLKDDDAELVMAEAIAAGNSPYETKIPLMATSVGATYRTKMFGWMKNNSAVVDETKPAARVALVYSPPSHDFVDKAAGQGLYATTAASAAEYWSTDAKDSVYQLPYLAEFTGLVKLLQNQHVPFEVLVRPTAMEIAGFQTVVLPDLEAVSDDQAALLRSYVDAGGHLIATGGNPTGWDQFGSARAEYALADVLGVSKSGALPATKTQPFGAGEARLISELPGSMYLTNAPGAAEAAATFMSAVGATTSAWLTTDADKRVHFELRRSADGQQLMLHQVNYIGMDGTFAVAPTSPTTTIHLPAGQVVTAVEMTSPDSATPTRSALAFTRAGQDVTFTTPVSEYAVVVLTLKQTSPAVNPAPAPAPSTPSSQGTGSAPGTGSVPGNDPAPGPSPTSGSAATVALRAVSDRSKLSVDVDPNVGKRYWKFKVQRLRGDGTWGERKPTYRTSGKAETKTLNLPKGTYRVRVPARFGLAEAVSSAVTLQR